MQQEIFSAADILLPDFSQVNAYQWSVIACDQFTGDPGYWQRTAQLTGESPSALQLILPEVYLEEPDVIERIEKIHQHMQTYLQQDVLKLYPDAMVYTERIQSNGILRTGVIGKIDLEAYDYQPDSQSPVRATEATVLERIPPRMKVRDKAILELPHIMLLIDDEQDNVIGACTEQKDNMQKLYATELMQGGGSITGYLMHTAQQQAFQKRLQTLLSGKGSLQFAMGDGNHSLATAKACYMRRKKQHPDWDFTNHPSRFALVELVNLHSPALQFEAIHRIVTKTDAELVFLSMKKALGLSENVSDQSVVIIKGDTKQKYYIHKPSSQLAVGSLQNALDAYLSLHDGKIDYIHGTETVEKLAAMPHSIGFLLPDMHKNALFPSVEKDGTLPRKTFSMGHAEDKRYYMECRKIR